MSQKEIDRYITLNELAGQNGIVILGGTDDKNIPLCELKQAFDLNPKLYNRSISELSIDDAFKIYDMLIAPLNPETVLLHIGMADIMTFTKNPSDFDQKYRRLINHIKAQNYRCRIAVISLKNPSADNNISELNRHLKYIAESEQCEYGDITSKRVWNPKETKNVVSFIHSMGFINSLTAKRPLYDLVKILYCYEPCYAN
ncbi:MAG: hypothetical protein IJZ25_04985 [Lachnospiraceae bacterium]|nr:hypothetical protein [Lachnospiraceae bacterium]